MTNTIEIAGRIYKLLEIIPKEHREHDLFICETADGYRECFQRFDLNLKPKTKRTSNFVAWTEEEIRSINKYIDEGKTAVQVMNLDEFKRHNPDAVYVRFNQIKRRKKWEEEMSNK